MEKNGEFSNYDEEEVYTTSQRLAQSEETENFVVEFGKGEARIAFDVNVDRIQEIIETPAPPERPIRWINIWAPHQQVDIVNWLGQHYDFSARLLAIIRSEPPDPDSRQDKHAGRFRSKKIYRKDDPEHGVQSNEVGRASSLKSRKSLAARAAAEVSHYTLANQMINYQSLDVGRRYLCVGANWMHKVSAPLDENDLTTEGQQKRLWSWLVLCDDHTVISLHEYPGQIDDPSDVKTLRANTLSVLSQLSNFGHDSADPISLQTVRQGLKENHMQAHTGEEGSSLLFFYLFDDWRGVYATVAMYSKRLEDLQDAILEDMGRNSSRTPNREIIPRLHILGRQVRQMQHLYEGYKNLIDRILEANTRNTAHPGLTPRSSSLTNMNGERGVRVSSSAYLRFERLGDRLQLLILSETKEFLAEKDALISTYFNINAQKDSEATARLTRSATLLAKLSVLFLPVSLMTSYFSIQIKDLEGVYTTKDYWYAFACIMSISFLFLFFFSRLLMWVTETLDAWVKKFWRALLFRFKKRGDDE